MRNKRFSETQSLHFVCYSCNVSKKNIYHETDLFFPNTVSHPGCRHSNHYAGSKTKNNLHGITLEKSRTTNRAGSARVGT